MDGRPERKRDILVVEDDADIADGLRMLLSPDYAVRSAASIAEARAALETARPDLVVLDVLLSDGSGYDVLGSIRASEIQRSVPVLVLTAFSAFPDIEEGFIAGANAYHTKPFDIDRLIAAIEHLLRESEATRPATG